jgi:hypothetical protein
MELMKAYCRLGSVWVNSHFDVDPKVPFGGHKEYVYTLLNYI